MIVGGVSQPVMENHSDLAVVDCGKRLERDT